MSTSAGPTSDPGSPPPAGAGRLLGAFFLAVTLIVAVVYLLPRDAAVPAKPDLALETWRPTPEALAAQAQRDRELLGSFTPGAAEAPLAEALARFNEAELGSDGSPSAPGLQAAQSALRAVAHRYVNDHGVDRFHALGLVYRDRFVAALEAVLADVRRTGERTSVYLARHPLAPETAAFRRWGGLFLDHALRAGLVGEDGRLQAGAEHLPGLFFLVRWFHWVQPVTDYTFRLSRTELAAFWTWKIEAHRALPLRRRLALVEQVLRVDPDYPAAYVRGVLLARAERWVEAAGQLREWLLAQPDDQRARANLRYVEEMAAIGG